MQKENITIRKARIEDVSRLAELLEELFSIEPEFEIDRAKQTKALEMLISSPETATIMVADANGLPVGMVSMQVLISTAQGSKVGTIEDMIVSKDFRGRGIGKQLLNQMAIYAQEIGLTRLQLLADVENTPALEFYDKNNWQYTGMIALKKFI